MLSPGERVVLLSVLVIVGTTTTSTVPCAVVGALHLETVPGTGSALELQTRLADWVQLTTKGMYNLPPLPAVALHSKVTLDMSKLPEIPPVPSQQASPSMFKNGLSVKIATEQLAADVNCGSVPSFEIKTPISYRVAWPKLTVAFRFTVMVLPPTQDARPLVTVKLVS